MKHRFLGLPAEITDTPIIPYMMAPHTSPSEATSIWLAGEELTPMMLSDSGDDSRGLAEPVLIQSEENFEIYWSTRHGSFGSYEAELRRQVVRPLAGAHSVLTEVSTSAIATGYTPHGSIHPTGSRVCFTDGTSIYSVEVDGTGLTTLHTLAAGYGVAAGPAYSSSGDFIMYCRRDTSNPAQIVVMNADGSGATVIFTAKVYNLNFGPGRTPSWQWGSDVLGFCDIDSQDSAHPAGGNDWYTINADGSGQTLILADGTSSDTAFFFGNGRASWLPDDSAMVVRERLSGTDCFAIGITSRLAYLFADGSGTAPLSPTRDGYGEMFGQKFVPATIPGPSSSLTARVYFVVDAGLFSGVQTYDLCSVLPDGSDFRVDHDVSAVRFPSNDVPIWKGFEYEGIN